MRTRGEGKIGRAVMTIAMLAATERIILAIVVVIGLIVRRHVKGASLRTERSTSEFHAPVFAAELHINKRRERTQKQRQIESMNLSRVVIPSVTSFEVE
jgi:hypothetical protein